MTDQQPRNTDAELTAFVTKELTTLPDELSEAERQMGNIALDLRMARAELEDEILIIQANAVADGKNAEARRLQLEKAALENNEVQEIRGKVTGLESMHLGAEANFNELLRRFKAATVLCELQTAKIQYRVTFTPKGH